MSFHAGNLGVNIRSIGVAFVGDFTHGAPTQAARDAGKALITSLSSLNTDEITITYIDGHTKVRKDGPTVCPGEWFEEFVQWPELSKLQRFPMPN